MCVYDEALYKSTFTFTFTELVSVEQVDAVLMCLDASVLKVRLASHTDAVWGLSAHSTMSHILSCSADGTVKLWAPHSSQSLLSNFVLDCSKYTRNVLFSILFFECHSPSTFTNVIDTVLPVYVAANNITADLFKKLTCKNVCKYS